MRAFRTLPLIVRVCIGIGTTLLLWKPIVSVIFAFAQGPDSRFDLGGGYELWGPPPRHIIYWPPAADREKVGFERVVESAVREFAIVPPWIIGRAENGWFAINRQTHEADYPLSKEQVQEAIGLALASVKLETDPMPYLIVSPSALAAKARANAFFWVLVFIVPTVLALGAYAIKYFVSASKNG
ncbi:MAG: hypothetical protein JSU94_08435 [Phycisphaerales bacterium]|nr:MAG: hypothetical protein JSU94_08435 [Phycisphaerales bacterium]